MISKELFSTITGTKIEEIKTLTQINDNIFLNVNYGIHQYDNKFYSVYELANKCKQWALSSDYEISSCTTTDGGWANIRYNSEFIPTVFRDSEYEAIFGACELLMKGRLYDSK